MNIKIVTAVVQGAAQTTGQRVRVKLEPSQTIEERVADEFMAKHCV